MHNKIIVGIAALALLCTVTSNAAPLENTQGGYLPVGPHYAVVNHCLYLYDGTSWFVLRRPQFDGGLMGGVKWGKGERWCKVGGSRVTAWARTPSTFRDQSKQPVMAQAVNF